MKSITFNKTREAGVYNVTDDNGDVIGRFASLRRSETFEGVVFYSHISHTKVVPRNKRNIDRSLALRLQNVYPKVREVLTDMQFMVFCYLVDKEGTTVNRDEMRDLLIPGSTSNIIDVQIKDIRKKLAAHSLPFNIRTSRYSMLSDGGYAIEKAL